MSIITHGAPYEAPDPAAANGPADAATLSRFAATADERRQTRMFLHDGRAVEANAGADVERRRDSLLGGHELPARMSPGAALERQIGGNDLRPVWFFDRAALKRRTVGRVHIRDDVRRRGFGTGFLVKSGLLATNAHVLESVEIAMHSRVEFGYEETFEGDQTGSAVFDLDPVTLFVSSPHGAGLDYALVAVAPVARDGRAALTEFGDNRLTEKGLPLKGESINIVHHPRGETKQASFRENRLLALDAPELCGIWMHYETDTDSGSSGAPLFNDQWEVVGIHHSAVEKRDESGAVLAVDGGRWSPEMGDRAKWWSANEGLRVSGLLADLKAQLAEYRAGGVRPGSVISAAGEVLLVRLLGG